MSDKIDLRSWRAKETILKLLGDLNERDREEVLHALTPGMRRQRLLCACGDYHGRRHPHFSDA
jgi:hypothetical protein